MRHCTPLYLYCFARNYTELCDTSVTQTLVGGNSAPCHILWPEAASGSGSSVMAVPVRTLPFLLPGVSGTVDFLFLTVGLRTFSGAQFASTGHPLCLMADLGRVRSLWCCHCWGPESRASHTQGRAALSSSPQPRRPFLRTRNEVRATWANLFLIWSKPTH